jgi:hypothetical protein
MPMACSMSLRHRIGSLAVFWIDTHVDYKPFSYRLFHQPGQ